MVLHRVENANKIRSLARFHFISGLPRSGVSVLASILAQNPRFTVRTGSTAQALFAKLLADFSNEDPVAKLLDDIQKTALFRGAIDAVYHDRPSDSVVFDANRNWLPYIDTLVRIYPLSRFIFCVRNPAAIANSLLLEKQGDTDRSRQEKAALALVGADGKIGRQINILREALSGRHAERILVLDYDRLADDPEDVLDVVSEFLHEPEYTYDYREIGTHGFAGVSGPVQRSANPTILPTRLVLQLSGRAFWRNLKRTSATMMLGRAW